MFVVVVVVWSGGAQKMRDGCWNRENTILASQSYLYIPAWEYLRINKGLRVGTSGPRRNVDEFIPYREVCTIDQVLRTI